MADTKTSPAMLLDELAPLDPNSGVRWPQLCGVWPRPSPRCLTVGTPLTRSGCWPTCSTPTDRR